MTVLRIFFYGCYVRSVQSLKDLLQRQENLGLQWLYRQYRSLKKYLGWLGRESHGQVREIRMLLQILLCRLR